MVRAHSTLFGFLGAAAALGIAGIASAWSWNAAIYIVGPALVFVFAARAFAGYPLLTYGRAEKDLERAADTGTPDGSEGMGAILPGMPASNNRLLASAYAEAKLEGMSGDALRRFAKVATRVDEDERAP